MINMKKEEFQKKIQEIYNEVQKLIADGGVSCTTALYGSLTSANLALALAVAHCTEFDEEFSNYKVNETD